VGGVGEWKGERRAVAWLLASSNGEVGALSGVGVEAEVEVEVDADVDVEVAGWRVELGLGLGGSANGSCEAVGELGREDEW
jgi:hypothetical protein